MAERDLINDILMRASELGARLFRVNTGMGWTGDLVQNGHRKMLVNLRPFHAGLVKGGSDVVGITPVLITEDMVGKTIGAFTAYEIKTGKLTATKDQKNFIEMVRRLGGIAKVVRSPDEIERVPKL